MSHCELAGLFIEPSPSLRLLMGITGAGELHNEGQETLLHVAIGEGIGSVFRCWGSDLSVGTLVDPAREAEIVAAICGSGTPKPSRPPTASGGSRTRFLLCLAVSVPGCQAAMDPKEARAPRPEHRTHWLRSRLASAALSHNRENLATAAAADPLLKELVLSLLSIRLSHSGGAPQSKRRPTASSQGQLRVPCRRNTAAPEASPTPPGQSPALCVLYQCLK